MDTDLPDSQELAEALGEEFFFPPKPCSAGHLAKRRTADGMCVECAKPARKPGRPSHIDPEMYARICDEVAAGKPVTVACRAEGVAPIVFYNYKRLRATDAERDAFEAARDVGADEIAASILRDIEEVDYVDEVAGDKASSRDNVARSRLKAEYKLKLLAKWRPKTYGDKLDVTTDGKEMSSASAPLVLNIVGRKSEE